MNLYRALYQSPPRYGSRLRGMTFCAPDASQATRIAADWQLSDRLLTVKALRPLQPAAVQLALVAP